METFWVSCLYFWDIKHFPSSHQGPFHWGSPRPTRVPPSPSLSSLQLQNINRSWKAVKLAETEIKAQIRRASAAAGVQSSSQQEPHSHIPNEFQSREEEDGYRSMFITNKQASENITVTAASCWRPISSPLLDLQHVACTSLQAALLKTEAFPNISVGL